MSIWRPLAPALLASALLAPIAGCNIVSPLAYAIHGPPTIPPRYKLDTTRVTVIFIDDRLSHAPRRSLRVVTAEEVEQTLMQEHALPEQMVITTRAAMRVAAQEQFTQPKTIAELGRAVGADVVIYASIDAWSLSPDGVTFSPAAQVRVKVIDAENDARLWPAEGSAGFPVSVGLPPQTQGMPTGADRDAANLRVAHMLGDRIAELFYDHAKNPSSPKMDD